MSNKTIVKELNRGSSLLRIVGICLILVSFVFFIYLTRRHEDNIQIKTAELEVKTTEILKKDSAIVQIEADAARTDSIRSVVLAYLEVRNHRDAIKLNEFYSDEIDRYFINLKNCKKSDVAAAEIKYWKVYKNDTFKIKSDPTITFSGDTAKALIQGTQCKTATNCVDVMLEIRLNENKKINFVRAFFSK